MSDRLLSDLMNWVREERDRMMADLEDFRSGRFSMGTQEAGGRLVDETPARIAFLEQKIAEANDLLARHIDA